MALYTQAQWLLLFFLYAFMGWIWESCYVSVKEREWVNRGFLHGPWLPIYGSGAIVILFTTLPVRWNLALVYVVGMVSATVLEYCTGAAMERIFGVRYWDYSQKPLNFHGHICLFVSLGWGVFSVFLVEVLHPPMEKLALLLPTRWADGVCLVLTVLFVVDATRSVQAGLKLRELLEKLTENSQVLAGLQERLEEATRQMSKSSRQFREKLEQIEAEVNQERERVRQAQRLRSQTRKEYLLEKLAERRGVKSRLMETLGRKTEAALEESTLRLSWATGEEARRIAAWQTVLMEFRAALEQAQVEQAARRDRDFQRAAALLYRNPGAASRHHGAAFAELRALLKRNADHGSEK